MITLGIDPGVSGGYTFLFDKHVECRKFTSANEFLEVTQNIWFENIGESKEGFNINPDINIWIERVHASPQMSPKAAFTFGENFGAIQGLVLSVFGNMVNFVRPQVWQHGIEGLKGIQGPERKRLLRAYAMATYPEVGKLTLATADSLLIAKYGENEIRNYPELKQEKIEI